MRNHSYDAKVQAASARCFTRISIAHAAGTADVLQMMLHTYHAHHRDAEARKWIALGVAMLQGVAVAHPEVSHILCQVIQDYPRDAEVQYIASLGMANVAFGLPPAVGVSA